MQNQVLELEGEGVLFYYMQNPSIIDQASLILYCILLVLMLYDYCVYFNYLLNGLVIIMPKPT